ncbi:MAG: hypothetical protein KJP21_09750, partial [Bacteroidia bacterium]|nr:hypothetical protein [Bacteroidia bacterium]
KGVDSFEYLQKLRTELLKLPYIEETYDFFEINEQSCKKPYMDLVRNSHSDNEGYFLKILAKEYYLIDMRDHGTTHGTPYSYDTHVPLIWYGSALKNEIINESVHTVDIAPTILGYLGIQLDEKLSGRDLFNNSSNK